jgi:hypothetical protein
MIEICIRYLIKSFAYNIKTQTIDYLTSQLTQKINTQTECVDLLELN